MTQAIANMTPAADTINPYPTLQYLYNTPQATYSDFTPSDDSVHQYVLTHKISLINNVAKPYKHNKKGCERQIS